MNIPLCFIAAILSIEVTTSSFTNPSQLALIAFASFARAVRTEQNLPWNQELTQNEPQGSKDWLETCNTHMTQMKISFPGCVSKSIITYACKGTCYSRSTPKWKGEVEEVVTVQHCMCCKPMARRFRMVTLDCPSRPKPKSLLVSAATECRCRPCSDAQPEGEKPYDY